MKKIFTCISLAAATFMATTPAMAQQQKLTDREKAAVIEAIIPAMLEQTKQVSGIDILGLANPNIENVLNSSLFGTSSTLRAETLVASPLSVQPDSMRVFLSLIDGIPAGITQMLGQSITLKMEDYKQYEITQAGGMTVQLSIPKTISTSILGNPVTLKFTIGDQTGFLPFSTLSADLNLGELGNALGLNGNLFAIKETAASAGVFDYNVQIGSSLRAILAMIQDSPTSTSLPNFLIKTNMTQQAKGLLEASLYGIPATSGTVQVPMGDAKVYMNPQAAAAGKMSPDSILLTSYENGKLEGYRKLATKTEQKGQNFVITTEDFSKDLDDTSWKLTDIETITMTDRTKSTNMKAIVAEMLTRSIAELAATGTTNPYSMVVTNTSDSNGDGQITADDKTETILKADVTTSMEGTPTRPAMTVFVKIQTQNDEDDQLTDGMDIAITLPLNSNQIAAAFIPVGYEGAVASMYFTSNAMGIITDNETIDSTIQEVKVAPVASGLYVKNGKGNYVIVNMVGKVVATGIITNDEQFISIPNMPKGIYAISIDKSNTNKLRSVHKTTVKFAK